MTRGKIGPALATLALLVASAQSPKAAMANATPERRPPAQSRPEPATVPAGAKEDEDPTRELRTNLTRQFDVTHELLSKVKNHAEHIDLTKRFEVARTGAEKAAHAKSKEGLEAAGEEIKKLRQELADKHGINPTPEEEEQMLEAFHQKIAQKQRVAPVVQGAGVQVKAGKGQVPGVPVRVDPSETTSTKVVAKHSPGQTSYTADPEVHKSQRHLVGLGVVRDSRKLNDGKYGPVTAEAVRIFQEGYSKNHNPDMTSPLVADGVLTEATRQALQVEYEKRMAERGDRPPRPAPPAREPRPKTEPGWRELGGEERPAEAAPAPTPRPTTRPAPAVPGVEPLTGATPTHFKPRELDEIPDRVRSGKWRNRPPGFALQFGEGLNDLVHGFGIFKDPNERKRVPMPLDGEGGNFESDYGYRVILADSERHGHAGRWIESDVRTKLMRTALQMKQAGAGDPLLIGDLGPQYGYAGVVHTKRGTSLDGHTSHRGRAADLYFYTLGQEHGAYAGRFDPERNLRLVKSLFDNGARSILLDNHIKSILIKQARASGESPQVIRTLSNKIAHWDGHEQHYHVFF